MATRNIEPCPSEVLDSNKSAYEANRHGRLGTGDAHDEMLAAAVFSREAHDITLVFHEPVCPGCGEQALVNPAKIHPDKALLTATSRSAGPIPVSVGSCTCKTWKMMVVFDGALCGLFVLPELDSLNRLPVFAILACQYLLRFVVNSRLSCSCASRHWAQTMPPLVYRRQTVIALGLPFLATLDVPDKLFMCPLCGPSPSVVIMDWKALGFRIPKQWNVQRCSMNVPVLPIPLDAMTIFPAAAQTHLVQHIKRNSTPLTPSESAVWMKVMTGLSQASLSHVKDAAAVIMMCFVPFDGQGVTIVRKRPRPE